MKFPHTITLFNRFEEDGRANYRATIIKGCLHRLNYAYPKSELGLQNGNEAHLWMPLTADTGGKEYISPDKYSRLTEQERALHYTFSPDSDFYALGELELTERDITTADIKELTGVYKIKTAELLDFGSKAMRHWEVTAT